MNKLNVMDLFSGNVEGCEFINEFDLELDDEEGVEIEEFDFSGCEIKLVKSDGYRGVGCYEGLVVKNGVSYYIDIVNEGVVYRIWFIGGCML